MSLKKKIRKSDEKSAQDFSSRKNSDFQNNEFSEEVQGSTSMYHVPSFLVKTY
jgi:hypothetical protein